MALLKDNYTNEDFPFDVAVYFHKSDDNGEDVVYFEVENMEHLIAINRLAAEFYSMNGRMFLPLNDFFGSNHPEEWQCFVKACLTFYLAHKLKGDE